MQQIHCNYLYFIRAKSQRRNILETAALSCSSCYQWSWITVNTFKYIHFKKKKIEWTVFILFFLNVFIFTQVPYKLKQCYSWLTAQSPGDSNIIIWALVAENHWCAEQNKNNIKHSTKDKKTQWDTKCFFFRSAHTPFTTHSLSLAAEIIK